MATSLKTYKGKTFSSIGDARRAKQADITQQRGAGTPDTQVEAPRPPPAFKPPSGVSVSGPKNVPVQSITRQGALAEAEKFAQQQSSQFEEVRSRFNPQTNEVEFESRAKTKYGPDANLEWHSIGVGGAQKKFDDLLKLSEGGKIGGFERTVAGELVRQPGQAPAPGEVSEGPMPRGVDDLAKKALLADREGDLANQNFWTNRPESERQAAFKKLEDIQSSPEKLADYVFEQGIANLESFKWWSDSPHKNKAWDIIQEKQKESQAKAQQGGQPTPLSNPSVVDFLEATGQLSDFNTRTQMAKDFGITNYTGTASQNLRLLALLREQHDRADVEAPAPTKIEEEEDMGEAEDKRDVINADANREQEEELAVIEGETDKVDLSTSAELVEQLTNILETEEEEPTKSLQEEFTEQRAALGVGELEGSLSQIDADIAKLDADMASLLPEEENRRVSVRQIRRRQSEEELQFNRQRRDLVAERNSIANQLNMKYGVLNTMVSLAGKDIDNAQQDYQAEFNRAIQMINLTQGIEDTAKTDAQRKTDNARANVQIMSNLLKSGNLNFDDLDEATRLDLKNMEIQAGLPIGFTEFVNEVIEEPITSFLQQHTDDHGNRIQPVGIINADGTFSVQNINLGQIKTVGVKNTLSGDGEDNYVDTTGSLEDAYNVPDGGRGGQCGRYVNNFSGLKLGNTYQSKFDAMDELITIPEPGMVFVMPYRETGHAGFIVSIEGNVATVKDSNWALDEKVKTHTIAVSSMTGFARVGGAQEIEGPGSSGVNAAIQFGAPDTENVTENVTEETEFEAVY